MLVILLCFSLQGCALCSHKNTVEATCTRHGYCKSCKTKMEPALGHDMIEATCLEPEHCERCGITQGETVGHIFSPATYESPKICMVCGTEEGEPMEKPASMWGFYDLDKMGNATIRIKAYRLNENNDPDNSYVYATGEGYKYENGYIFEWGFEVENGKCVFGIPSYYCAYKTINNENLVSSDSPVSFSIIERKYYDTIDDFVVFVFSEFMHDSWQIPYSLIDWDRPAEISTEEGHYGEYILYLK